MRKLLIPCIVLAVVSLSNVSAQRYYELGLGAGFTFYNGDLNPSRFFPDRHTHPGIGILYRYNWNPRWSVRYAISYGRVSASDGDADGYFQQNRNLSFESDVLEGYAAIDFNFFSFKPYKAVSLFQSTDTFTPFVFGGVGIFNFNPQAELNGNLYDLSPLRTEGVDYSRTSLFLVFGLGIKMRVSDRFILSLEAGLRRSFTDYLDDVSGSYPLNPEGMTQIAQNLSDRSLEPQGPDGTNWGTQRGNSQTKDVFSFYALYLTYNLTRNPNRCHFNPLK